MILLHTCPDDILESIINVIASICNQLLIYFPNSCLGFTTVSSSAFEVVSVSLHWPYLVNYILQTTTDLVYIQLLGPRACPMFSGLCSLLISFCLLAWLSFTWNRQLRWGLSLLSYAGSHLRAQTSQQKMCLEVVWAKYLLFHKTYTLW